MNLLAKHNETIELSEKLEKVLIESINITDELKLSYDFISKHFKKAEQENTKVSLEMSSVKKRKFADNIRIVEEVLKQNSDYRDNLEILRKNRAGIRQFVDANDLFTYDEIEGMRYTMQDLLDKHIIENKMTSELDIELHDAIASASINNQKLIPNMLVRDVCK